MPHVTSKDGTSIAYTQTGSGPAVILITGALGVRYDDAFAELLAPHFTVYNLDRRGRGESGDTAPFAVEREIEDIEALIDIAGGSAALQGNSSGAILALEAANRLSSKVTKLSMFEPPFITEDSRPPVPADYVEQLEAAIAAGKPGDAVEIFMTQALLIPDEFLSQMRYMPPSEVFGMQEGVTAPMWTEMEKVAHTLSYDGRVALPFMQGKPLPTDRWTSVTMPTLVIVGGNSEPFFHDGAASLVDMLPNARVHVLEGQDHAVQPQVLAPVVIEFLKS
jgi:pimeloyl-ACP methyl ester carboxylesterase